MARLDNERPALFVNLGWLLGRDQSATESTLNNQPTAALTEQFFDAFDQALDRERLDEIFHLMRREKLGDVRIGGEASDEDEAVREIWPCLDRPDVKLIAAQPRHHKIADHSVVLIHFDLESGLLPVERDINEKIFVCQDPLQRGGELFVVVHHEDRLELEGVNGAFNSAALRVVFHSERGLVSTRSATRYPGASPFGGSAQDCVSIEQGAEL